VECCSQLTVCLENAECKAIYTCAQGCSTGSGSESCLDACGAAHPSGVDAYNALFSCANACTAACASNTGGS
jgi:hypothetical protein